MAKLLSESKVEGGNEKGRWRRSALTKPFTLSLSKRRTTIAPGFDRLSPNGYF
jgi:hypothetical protein